MNTTETNTAIATLSPISGEKGKANVKPWAGSYFGIPEPEKVDDGKPKSFTTVEAEIHILLKNLTVEVHTIKHDRQHQFISPEGVCHLGMFDPQDISMPLKEKAWKRDDAIGFVVYYTNTSSLTGIKKKGMQKCLCARVDQFRWKYVYDKDLLASLGETDNDHTFIPDVVKMKNPHVFSKY